MAFDIVEEARPDRRRIKAVANALRLLEALKEAGEPVPLGRLSQQLGLSKGTVHLLLSTLSEYDFVEPALVHGQYRLGLGAFEVGIAAVDHRGMPPEIALPMERLASESLEAVSLAVQSGHDALIVRRFESAHILRAEIGVGTRMPLYASASGKSLLAEMPQARLDALYPAEDLPNASADHNRIRTKSQLRKELERVRRQGYATNQDEFVVGVAAVARVVRDRQGQAVASLSIAGPTARFDGRRWIEPLVRTADEMTGILGFRARQ
jgi:DNA-binding IclR family transcriptional regulator